MDDLGTLFSLSNWPGHLSYTLIAISYWLTDIFWLRVVAVIGSVAVLVSSMFSRDPKVEQPDGILRQGSCVAFEPNGDAREVTCTGGADDIVVQQLVPLDGQCPTGTVGHRDRQGLGIACVAA